MMGASRGRPTPPVAGWWPQLIDGADPAAAAGQVACPTIAMLRGTIVDLGELEPGTWTLARNGDLAPVAITIQ
jgi:hypothetical protein